MGSPNQVRRYRINPLELAIFTLVTAGFSYSVFHLFRDAGDLQFATLAPMQVQPNRMVPERSIASIGGAIVDGVSPPQRIPFEVNCAENPGFQFGDKVCPNTPTLKGRNVNDVQKLNPTLTR